jgi:7-carboxy-7-deazaguanine synthase
MDGRIMNNDIMQVKLPMVEIFQTVEGEGLKAGFPTTFVRLYNCNLRCTWCDTKYSYAPYKPEFYATIGEIVEKVASYGNHYVCLTGGEPLMHGEKSLQLVQALAEIPVVRDVHIETNGSIPLDPYCELRQVHPDVQQKVRFIMDYKLTSSGEKDKMVHENFALLDMQDEIKFVVANAAEFEEAAEVIRQCYRKAQLLFSPVFGALPPYQLVEMLLNSPYKEAKISLQVHKYIWDPEKKGV